MNDPPDTRCLALPPGQETGSLRQVREFIDQVAVEIGLDDEQAFDLKVAVSEACANAVQHGGERGGLRICAQRESERLVFEVSDGGDFRLPMLSPDGAQANRGLGLPLMVTLMDEVRFHRVPGGGTLVSLAMWFDRRHGPPAAPPDPGT